MVGRRVRRVKRAGGEGRAEGRRGSPIRRKLTLGSGTDGYSSKANRARRVGVVI